MSNLTTVNPATGAPGRSYPSHSMHEALEAAGSAHDAFLSWRHTPLEKRAALLRSLAAILRSRRETLANLATEEMGKLTAEALAEIDKCAHCCEFLAEHGPAWLADRPVQTEFSQSFISYRPLGVILAIMPWNFPFWQVIRAAAPALLAGNTMLLKHASNTPGCALALEDAFRDAGAPAQVFRTLLLPSSQLAPLIEHTHIRGVTLTGSTPAGRDVASIAGRHLKKTVLELGGSDAYVILEDADISLAARVCAQGRFVNGGQSCIAAKRLIVVDAVRDAFTRALLAEFKRYVPESTLPPLARGDLRVTLHDQVARSVALGARCLTGGVIPSGPGYYYPATLLADVRPGMPAYEEELFGPAAALIYARDEGEALTIANASEFGLGAAVFTSDAARGSRIARDELEAGCCFVNAFVRSDPRLPFGGIKDSGYGRELSMHGLHEFVNIKTVAVA